MSIYGDLQKFNQDARIVLYTLDATNKSAGVFNFHSGTNEFNQDVYWQGVAYTAIPINAVGFEFDGTKFPRPKLQIANMDGLFSTLARQYGDLINCKLIRRQTTARYLDAANFTGGNPNANPAEHFPDEIYYVVQKTAENRMVIEWELGSSLDLKGVMLPKRQVITVCPFKYRGGEGCDYAGGAVADETDSPTSDISKDVCSHTVRGCKMRFGEKGELAFGGFAGAVLVDYR